MWQNLHGPCKQVAQVKNSSVQKFVQTRANGFCEWLVRFLFDPQGQTYFSYEFPLFCVMAILGEYDKYYAGQILSPTIHTYKFSRLVSIHFVEE